jgi:uncharacterized protein (TIGR02058 family)
VSIYAGEGVVAHNALPGVWEVAGLSHPNEHLVEVQVAVPLLDQVRRDDVLAVLPFDQKTLVLKESRNSMMRTTICMWRSPPSRY